MLADIRHAIRVLIRSRAVTAIAVLALALGIGANTAIFSVIHAVLLTPLPYGDPDRLVAILQPNSNPISPADFIDLRAQAKSFEAVGAAQLWGGSLTGREAPQSIIGMQFSEDLFRTLAVAPIRGRTFDAADFEPGRNRVLVLSYGLWQRAFGGSDSVVGQGLQIDGASYTVIGIMPPSFRFAPGFWVTQAEMWSPLDMTGRTLSRNGNSLRVFARLKPGVALSTAQSELNQFARSLEAAYPATNTGRTFVVESLPEKAVGNVKPALQVLLGAVGLVLLIACANVANLALARATARQREIAVRVSLGAQRSRIIRQFLTESVTLSIAGGAVGLLLAMWGTNVLQSMVQPDAGAFRERLTGWNQIGLDLPVLVFTFAVAILTGLLSGLAPAFSASRRDVNSALKEGSRGSTSGGSARLRRLLVASEIAVALVLLAGAGLLLRSFVKLRAIDPGFDPHNVISLSVSLNGRPELVGDARASFYRTVIDRVQSVPGVQQAALVNHVPLVGDVWGTPFAVEGRPVAAPGKENNAVFRVSHPGYFAAMGVHLLSGRDFNERDTLNAPSVVVINDHIAKKQFPNENPIGKRITFGNPLQNPQWVTIVGVINDMKIGWADPAVDELYLPFLQSREFLLGTRPHNAQMMLVARTSMDADRMIRPVKEAIWSVDRNLPISGAQTLEHAVGNATWQTRFSLLLIGVFSSLALVLAMIGIYGVMAYEVAQRTAEIGIRMALGAGRGGIARMILGQSLPVAMIGIVVGIGAAAALVRLMKTMLFGIEAFDPLTFALVPLLVLMVATAAAIIPARRAMKVDPMIALRQE